MLGRPSPQPSSSVRAPRSARVAGDRSLVALVAHELAHSWSGNLVTNASWADFWLNEGFTVYFERRILEEVYGRERAEMETVLGWNDLEKGGAADDRARGYAAPQVELADPNASATIAYEKGAIFLLLIEETVGRRRFDRFLREWFDQNAFTSQTTAGFEGAPHRAVRRQRDAHAGDPDVRVALRAGDPIERSTSPKRAPVGRFDRDARLHARQHACSDELPAKAWSTHEWIHFLQELPHDLSVEKMTELDKAWQLTVRGNSQILNELAPALDPHRLHRHRPRARNFSHDAGAPPDLEDFVSRARQDSRG